MSDRRKRNRRILIATMAALAAVAIVVPFVGMVMATGQNPDMSASATSATAEPTLTIKPLPIRPVVSAFVTTPDECPPPDPAPPDKPMRICDIAKTAVYELSPEALRVQLVDVDSFFNPLNGVQTVTMKLTDESAREFGEFTASRVGQQVAFVRDGTVVWGPKITEKIDGQILQLSGDDLTAEQAKEIAKMLRDDS